MSTPHPSPTGLQRRLVYALLRPAVRLARRFRLPLKALESLCRLAYFEELRLARGLPHTDIARALDMSPRTVATLEKQLRGDFLAPAREVEFARRVEDALGEARTVEAVAADLDAPPDDVRRTVEGLVGSGRVRALGDDTFVVDRAYVSLVEDALAARIDGLNHQLDVIAAAVVSRFLNGPGPSLARTLSFVADPARVEQLADRLARELRRQCGDTEEEALRDGAHENYALTFALAPTDVDEEIDR